MGAFLCFMLLMEEMYNASLDCWPLMKSMRFLQVKIYPHHALCADYEVYHDRISLWKHVQKIMNKIKILM
ncbi:hypothetical protein Peur_054077 [Populus x canadensis]